MSAGFTRARMVADYPNSSPLMIQAYAQSHGPVLGFRLSGTLHATDYAAFEPAIQSAVERHGRLRLLLHFEEFAGWDAGALWSDLKFRALHFVDIERLAFVGENGRDKAVAMLLRPFTAAELRYFDVESLTEAWAWLEEGLKHPSPIGLPSLLLPAPSGNGQFRPTPF